jgi:hypothetical protein
MYNAYGAAPLVIILISGASGIAAGLVAMHYFRLDPRPNAQRLFVFWPIFFLVSGIIFIICCIIVGLVVG